MPQLAASGSGSFQSCSGCGGTLSDKGTADGRAKIPEAPILEVRSSASVRRMPLTAPTYHVGRHPDNDIVVDSPIVSRYHLVLERQNGGYCLRDTSSNGTWQAGRRVSLLQLTGQVELTIGSKAEDQVILVYRPASSRPASAPPFPPVSLDGRTRVLIGRDPACDLLVTDPMCSRQHAVVERGRDATWTLRDLASSNGTFVNGSSIRRAALVPGTVLQVGNTRIVFDGGRLLWTGATQGMRVDVRDVVTLGDQGRVLLDGVSFSVWPGELVGILGVSGAGKSTLLGALNGLRPATSGDVFLNGVDFYRHRDAFLSGIGYVPQDDIVHRELTVERALWYAARLRMPTDTSTGELRRRIDTVLDEVGLTGRRTTPIAKLSGGQRKRVNIGVEILTRPPLLLLDEPTSGLDPGLDRQLMTLLDRFASEGQSVVVVTHAVGNIDRCDQVVFLANGGRLAFYGSPKEGREYFSKEDFAEIYRTVEAERDAVQWRDQFKQSPAYATNVAARLQAIPPDADGRRSPSLASATRPRPTVRHFAVLSQRYLEIIWRDRWNLAFLLGQAPVVALMLWLVADPKALTAPQYPVDSHKLLFLMACAATWFGIINSVREIVKEAAAFQREHNVGVGIGPYVASKLGVLGLLAAAQTGLLVGLVMPWLELPADGVLLPVAVEMYVTLFATSLAGVAFGLALSSIVTTPDRAMSLTPLLLLPQIVFAGTIFKLEGAADAFAHAAATRPAVQALVSSVKLAFDAHGNVLEGFARSADYLIGRWLILLALILAGLGVTAISLRARDAEGSSARRWMRALLP